MEKCKPKMKTVIVSRQREKKYLKTISRLLVLVMMITSVLALFGCDFLNMQSDQTTTTTQRKDKKAEDLIKDMKEKMVAAGYEEMKMRAEFYHQASFLSRIFSFTLEIIDDVIYINGIVYDEVVYDSEYELMIHPEALIEKNEPSIKEQIQMIESIQQERGFYIIKTQSVSTAGPQVVIYEMGNTYYFFSIFYDNNLVYRINKAVID